MRVKISGIFSVQRSVAEIDDSGAVFKHRRLDKTGLPTPVITISACFKSPRSLTLRKKNRFFRAPHDPIRDRPTDQKTEADDGDGTIFNFLISAYSQLFLQPFRRLAEKQGRARHKTHRAPLRKHVNIFFSRNRVQNVIPIQLLR